MQASYCPSHNEWSKAINLGGWCPQETEPRKGSELASVLESWALSRSDQVKHGDKKSMLLFSYITSISVPVAAWCMDHLGKHRDGGSLTSKAQAILVIS